MLIFDSSFSFYALFNQHYILGKILSLIAKKYVTTISCALTCFLLNNRAILIWKIMQNQDIIVTWTTNFWLKYCHFDFVENDMGVNLKILAWSLQRPYITHICLVCNEIRILLSSHCSRQPCGKWQLLTSKV